MVAGQTPFATSNRRRLPAERLIQLPTAVGYRPNGCGQTPFSTSNRRRLPAKRLFQLPTAVGYRPNALFNFQPPSVTGRTVAGQTPFATSNRRRLPAKPLFHIPTAVGYRPNPFFTFQPPSVTGQTPFSPSNRRRLPANALFNFQPPTDTGQTPCLTSSCRLPATARQLPTNGCPLPLTRPHRVFASSPAPRPPPPHRVARPQDVAKYAEPVGTKLYFAGDGTSLWDAAVAHGAYATGLFTAWDVMKAKRLPKPSTGWGLRQYDERHYPWTDQREKMRRPPAPDFVPLKY